MARYLDIKTTRVVDIEDTRGLYDTKYSDNPLARKTLAIFYCSHICLVS